MKLSTMLCVYPPLPLLLGELERVDVSVGIVSLYEVISYSFDSSRVCIKIPSTWQGLQACRILQEKGIKTLATTLFTIEQAALAGEVGCHYIAPYVHELKVQTEKG